MIFFCFKSIYRNRYIEILKKTEYLTPIVIFVGQANTYIAMSIQADVKIFSSCCLKKDRCRPLGLIQHGYSLNPCRYCSSGLVAIDYTVDEPCSIGITPICPQCIRLWTFVLPTAETIQTAASAFAERRMIDALTPCISEQLGLNNLTATGIVGIIARLLAGSNGE